MRCASYCPASTSVAPSSAAAARGKMRRQHHAQAERRQPRIGIAQAKFCRAAAVPGGEHAEHRGEIFDDHLRAEFVDVEFGNQCDAKRPLHVEEEAAAILRRRLGDDEIGDDLALRRQQRAEARRPGLELENVGGDKPMQKVPRAVTGDFDHAAVGEQGSLHGKKLSKYCKERRTPADFSQGSDTQ